MARLYNLPEVLSTKSTGKKQGTKTSVGGGLSPQTWGIRCSPPRPREEGGDSRDSSLPAEGPGTLWARCF